MKFFDYFGDGTDKCSADFSDTNLCSGYEPVNYCPNCGRKLRKDKEMDDKQGLSLEQARYELGDIDSFCSQVCGCCTANDWYCPTECADLEKARRMDFDRIVKSYARNWGDLAKVMRYIKQAKVV